VRVGDYYYFGWGGLGDPDPTEAAAHYRLASDAGDAQGHFNLALAHHYGDGLARDPQLAKRHYDDAAARTDPASSALPVTMMLWALWFDNAWRALVDGDRSTVADDESLAGLYDWWWGRPAAADVVGGGVKRSAKAPPHSVVLSAVVDVAGVAVEELGGHVPRWTLAAMRPDADTVLAVVFLCAFVGFHYVRYRIRQLRRELEREQAALQRLRAGVGAPAPGE